MTELANHVWQSTLFAGAVVVLTLAFRSHAASVRYGLWLAASVKFLVPFALLIALGGKVGWLAPVTIDTPTLSSVIEVATVPFSNASAAVSPSAPGSTASSGLAWLNVGWIIWSAGFAAVLTVWTARWRRVAAAARFATPLSEGHVVTALRRIESAAGVTGPLTLTACAWYLEPGVFGILRPTLLWPKGFEAHLDEAELEAILAHELAHVRRRDNLAAAVHMLVQAIFWFHPLVWWIGTRLVDERERACDEDVIRMGCRPENYAEGILKTCRLSIEAPLACVAGISGSDLTQRIAIILRGTSPRPLDAWKKAALAGAATISIAAPMVAGAVPSAPEQRSEVPTNLRFDVASVKRADPNERGRVFGFTPQTGRLRLVNLTFGRIVRAAYGVEFPHSMPEERVSGGPEWMESDLFTIEATAGRPVTPVEMTGMLRNLLIERFTLVARVEPRELPVFNLTTVNPGRLGPQLRTSEVDCRKAARCGIGGRAGRFLLSATTMALLADSLEELTGRPVFDRTALEGSFDGTLEWTPSPDELHHFGPGDPNAPPLPVVGPSLYTALQDQFGLRLVAARGPVDFLVIDSASKPSEN